MTDGKSLRFSFSLSVAILGLSCVAPRSHSIFSLDFSAQPPRAYMRATCGGETFTTQGVVVCEQKSPSVSSISVKIQPLMGKVVYSNGRLKRTEDFNWYPKEGFFIWKKRPIKDTWVDLDLGEINALFGDWPVAFDVAGLSEKTGVIVTRGILYHRICNDRELPCSKLVVNYECGAKIKSTGVGRMGKCERLAGGPMAVAVPLGPEILPGSVFYLKSGRNDFDLVHKISAIDLEQGQYKFQIPEILTGPSIYILALDTNLKGVTTTKETRLLVVGYDAKWTGLDQPHVMDKDSELEFVGPVESNLLEVNTYKGQVLQAKVFTEGKSKTITKPKPDETVCAFAWQRDSSDMTAFCQDSKGNEVTVP